MLVHTDEKMELVVKVFMEQQPTEASEVDNHFMVQELEVVLLMMLGKHQWHSTLQCINHIHQPEKPRVVVNQIGDKQLQVETQVMKTIIEIKPSLKSVVNTVEVAVETGVKKLAKHLKTWQMAVAGDKQQMMK